MAGSGTAHLRADDDVVLRVENLVVEFPVGTTGDIVHAVSDVSLDLRLGETLGLVGESGCGKSTTGKAIMQVPAPTSGSVVLEGTDLTALDDEALRRTRPVLQMIFQDPISALNPRRTVRDIIAEPLLVWWEEEDGRSPLAVLFDRYGSIVATVLRQISRPLRFLAMLLGVGILFWLLAEAADGRALEEELSWARYPGAILGGPGLIGLALAAAVVLPLGLVWLLLALLVPFGAVSRLIGGVSTALGLAGAALTLAITGFLTWRTWNSLSGWPAWGLRGLAVVLTLVVAVWFAAALVRPSRAGASGVASALVGLLLLQVFYIAGLDDGAKLLVLLASAAIDAVVIRLVLQRMKVRRDELRERAEPQVRELLETVGINPDDALDRRPFEFSGGQAQRLSIARALVMEPKVIICDEPVSALDVSVQAQILNLLEDMKGRYGLTLVFIAHDLAVVKNVSDRVAVMYLGKLCEVGHPDTLYARPAHPYTELLLSAIPHPDPLIDPHLDRPVADLPSPIDPPSGCRFRTRCPRARERCAAEEPVMRLVQAEGNGSPAGADGGGQFVACHYPLVPADGEDPTADDDSIEDLIVAPVEEPVDELVDEPVEEPVDELVEESAEGSKQQEETS